MTTDISRPPEPPINHFEDLGYAPEPVPLEEYAAESSRDSDGWEFVDLGPVLSGEFKPPTPEIGLRTDGVGVLYPGRVHSLASEPGGSKTWCGLHFIAEMIVKGRSGVLVDYEDTPAVAVHRLRLMGLTDTQILQGFVYVRPTGPLIDRAGRIQVTTVQRLEELHADLVVVDSVGESLATEGLNPNDDDAVTLWFRRLPRMLARSGATVLVLDHVTKNRESRGLFAIGSQRKLAAIDGAAYGLEVQTAPTKAKDGHLRLVCAKDRHGTYQRGTTVAEITIHTTGGDGVQVVLAPPDQDFRPTRLMEAVSRFLEDEGTSSGAGIERGVTGKAEFVRKAREILVSEGFVSVEKAKRGNAYTSVIPYREDDDTPDNAPRPTSSQPRPTDPGRGTHTTQNRPRPSSPSLRGDEDETGMVSQVRTTPDSRTSSQPDGTTCTRCHQRPAGSFSDTCVQCSSREATP